MNTGCPTGEGTPTDGFLAWRNAAAKMDDMDVGRVVQGGTVSDLAPEIVDAYNAPFPDKTYKSGAHQFPLLVPISPDMEAAAYTAQAHEKLKSWKQTLLRDVFRLRSGHQRRGRGHAQPYSICKERAEDYD